MKRKIKIIFTCIICIFVLQSLCFAAGRHERSQSRWQRIIEFKPKLHIHNVHYAGFLNAAFGITVGPGGVVHYSTDKSTTWTEGRNSSMCLFGLDIIDTDTAFSCGNGANVITTENNGKTWTRLLNYGDYEPDHCRFLSFIDRDSGWIASPHKCAATSDGGKTWKEIDLPKNLKNIDAIMLQTEQEGYLLDTFSGTLFITHDGGIEWESVILKVNSGKKTDAAAPIAAIRFLNKEQGTIIFYQFHPENKWICMTTYDGGRNWDKQVINEEFGYIYLNKDGKILTITKIGGARIVLLGLED